MKLILSRNNQIIKPIRKPLLCYFCKQEKGRSRNFRSVHSLKYHISNLHKFEIRILDVAEVKS